MPVLSDDRDLYGKNSAFVKLRRDFNFASHDPNELVSDPKAEASAAVLSLDALVCLLERLEKLLDAFLAYPNTTINNLYDKLAFAVLGALLFSHCLEIKGS